MGDEPVARGDVVVKNLHMWDIFILFRAPFLCRKEVGAAQPGVVHSHYGSGLLPPPSLKKRTTRPCVGGKVVYFRLEAKEPLAAALPSGKTGTTLRDQVGWNYAEPSVGNMDEAALVKEELAEKQQALEALQRNFDDFQESSRELEEELEAELGRVSPLLRVGRNQEAGRQGHRESCWNVISEERGPHTQQAAILAVGRPATDRSITAASWSAPRPALCLS